jgi:hypothetical protein
MESDDGGDRGASRCLRSLVFMEAQFVVAGNVRRRVQNALDGTHATGIAGWCNGE